MRLIATGMDARHVNLVGVPAKSEQCGTQRITATAFSTNFHSTGNPDILCMRCIVGVQHVDQAPSVQISKRGTGVKRNSLDVVLTRLSSNGCE